MDAGASSLPQNLLVPPSFRLFFLLQSLMSRSSLRIHKIWTCSPTEKLRSRRLRRRARYISLHIAILAHCSGTHSVAGRMRAEVSPVDDHPSSSERDRLFSFISFAFRLNVTSNGSTLRQRVLEEKAGLGVCDYAHFMGINGILSGNR